MLAMLVIYLSLCDQEHNCAIFIQLHKPAKAMLFTDNNRCSAANAQFCRRTGKKYSFARRFYFRFATEDSKVGGRGWKQKL